LNKRANIFINIFIIIGVVLVIIGSLIKIIYWPYSSQLTSQLIITGIILTLAFYFFDYYFKKE